MSIYFRTYCRFSLCPNEPEAPTRTSFLLYFFIGWFRPSCNIVIAYTLQFRPYNSFLCGRAPKRPNALFGLSGFADFYWRSDSRPGMDNAIWQYSLTSLDSPGQSPKFEAKEYYSIISVSECTESPQNRLCLAIFHLAQSIDAMVYGHNTK